MAKIAIIDDEAPILTLIGQVCRRMGHEPAMYQTGREGLAGLDRNPPDLVIVDLRIGDVNGLEIIQQCRVKHPRAQVVMVTGYGSVETAVEAMRLGAFDYLTKPFAIEDLRKTIDRALRHESQPPAVTADSALPPADDNGLPSMPSLSAAATAAGNRNLSGQAAGFLPILPAASGKGGSLAAGRGAKEEGQAGAAPFIAESPAMRDILKTIRKVANLDSPVLLEGEFGSGKQAVARALHNASRRHGAPFKVLTCGALPESLLEQELFGGGVISNAFTVSKVNDASADTAGNAGQAGESPAAPSVFQRAAGGTVVLEEIHALPLRLQVMLESFLDGLNVRRLSGGALPPDQDFRLLATSSVPLETAVAEGRMREDLYYRLSVIPLTIPPLRMRREDVGLLAAHFLDHHSRLTGSSRKELDPQALRLLEGYSWPGNAGELRNAIERACAFADDQRIRPVDLPPKITRSPASLPPAGSAESFGVSTSSTTGEAGEETAAGSSRTAAASAQPLPVGGTLSDFIKKQERLFIRETLRHNGGSREKTASMLGVSIATLYRKMGLKLEADPSISG
jgi:DNA-binding NtrC family response regulator